MNVCIPVTLVEERLGGEGGGGEMKQSQNCRNKAIIIIDTEIEIFCILL